MRTNYKQIAEKTFDGTYRLKDVFRDEDGAIDLASIMVGVIVIGLIGGVIAATIFAVIPWAQDAAAKQQLDSITQAENSYRGFTSTGNLSSLPAGASANTYSSSPMLAQANLLIEAPNYCVVARSAGTGYNSYSLSGSGKIWTTDDKNTPARVYSGAWADVCPTSYTTGNTATPSPSATVDWPGQYLTNQSVALGTAAQNPDIKTLSFSLPKSYSTYTVTWSDNLGTMNGSGTAVDTSTLTDSNGQPYWAYKITPGSGGWSAGSSTVTATITDTSNGQVTTKTWNIATASGTTSGAPMWNVADPSALSFVRFSTSAANPRNMYVTYSTDGVANQWSVGGHFNAMMTLTVGCTANPGTAGPATEVITGTAVATMNVKYINTDPGYNEQTASVACDWGYTPTSVSGSIPTEGDYESNWGPYYWDVAANIYVPTTTSWTTGP